MRKYGAWVIVLRLWRLVAFLFDVFLAAHQAGELEHMQHYDELQRELDSSHLGSDFEDAYHYVGINSDSARGRPRAPSDSGSSWSIASEVEAEEVCVVQHVNHTKTFGARGLTTSGGS